MERRERILRRYNILRLFLLVAFVALVASAKAQLDEDITVTAHGDAERKIIFTERMAMLPNVVDTSFNAYPVSYQLIPVNIDVNLIPQTITPVKLTVLEPLPQIYKGYIKAGLGNYLMPYADFFYNSVRNKSRQWGVNVKHHSSQGGIKDIGYNGFNDNRVAFDLQRFYYKYSIGGKLSYDRNSFQYYGYNPEVFDTFDKKNTRQAFNIVKAQVSYQTHYKDSAKINNKLMLDYRFMNDNYSLNENYFKLTGGASKFMDKEVYGLDYSLDFNSLLQPAMGYANGDALTNFVSLAPNQTNNAILDINPNIRTGGENWKVRAGLAIQADIANSAKFFFYPDAEVDFSLYDDLFIPYLGVTGGLERNSFYTMTRMNPFILSNSEFKATNNKFDFHGGIRGTVSSKISFNVRGSVKKFNDLALFVNDGIFTEANNSFRPIYDTVTLTTISAQTTYAEGEKIKLALRGEYNIYEMLREDYAWNLPNYKVTLSGVYDLADKIIARADFFVVGDRLTTVTNEVGRPSGATPPYELKPFVDLNLGLEYRYTKRVSAFLNLNNILNQKYENWNFYRVQGFNVLGGVTYRF